MGMVYSREDIKQYGGYKAIWGYKGIINIFIDLWGLWFFLYGSPRRGEPYKKN